jgi:two-component system sensor histidine kinase GlrK
MSIYKKMMIGFGIIILVMMIVNAYELFELNAVSQAAKTTLNSDVQAIDLAKQLQSTLYEEERNGQKYLISRDNTYFTLFMEDTAQFVQRLDSLAHLPLDRQKTQLLERVRARHASSVSAIIRDRYYQLQPEPGVPPAGEVGWADSIDTIHGTLADFIRLNQFSIGGAMRGVEATTHRSLNIALFLTVFAVLTAVAAALIITRTITRPIRVLIKGVQQIAHGKFAPIMVTSNDEVALLTQAVNDMSAQLNRINELKEEMMHHIAHELRTPLATMLTAHYLLTEHSKENLNAEQLRLLTVLRNGIDKVTTFSHDFLDLSKIEAGMMEYNFERTDLAKFIQPLVDNAALTASPKDVAVKLLANPAPEVLVDREKLEQVVNNLLSNAIKYTDTGGVITVSVAPCDMGVRIAVQDTGVGIAPEDLPKVFAKFYRVRTATRTGTKGTGVGLALVKAVTEGHGGKVSVTSTVGDGSTFTIDIPSAPQSTSAAGAMQAQYSGTVAP